MCIRDRLQQLEVSIDDLKQHVNFRDDGYCRNLVHLGPGYAALVLCWKSGQSSPIHDHSGSACGLRILKGQANEVRYTRTADGSLTEADRNSYDEGCVCGTYDADIHTLINQAPDGEELVTLHVYTPPLRNYHTYEMDGSSRLCEDQEVLAEERRRRQAAASV